MYTVPYCPRKGPCFFCPPPSWCDEFRGGWTVIKQRLIGMRIGSWRRRVLEERTMTWAVKKIGCLVCIYTYYIYNGLYYPARMGLKKQYVRIPMIIMESNKGFSWLKVLWQCPLSHCNLGICWFTPSHWGFWEYDVSEQCFFGENPSKTRVYKVCRCLQSIQSLWF